MRTFYFTYGSSGQPFIGGWTEVNAPIMALPAPHFAPTIPTRPRAC